MLSGILCDEANEVYLKCLRTVSKNLVNDHILCMLLSEIDPPEKSKYCIKSARHLLLACLLYEENGEAQEPTNDAYKPKTVEFKPYQPKYRKRGTGSVHQVSKNVLEGRYTPTVNGKRIARNIYADSEEECEVKLEELIKEMKAEFGIR